MDCIKLFIIYFMVISHAIAYQKADFNKAERLKTLTKIQYTVTQRNGTESAYKNLYWANKQPGIYVDVVSGEPLFSSTHKYDSKTGWPSFYQPISHKAIKLTQEKSWFLGTRIEVSSSFARSHLGHVFDDGPPPTYKRFCINSAALKFIPKEQMQQAGYGEYLYLFSSP